MFLEGRRTKMCLNQAFLCENAKPVGCGLCYVMSYSKSSTFYCNKIGILVENWKKHLSSSLVESQKP